MPYRDKFGIWRKDPKESNGPKNPCKRCKGTEWDAEIIDGDDDFDGDMASDWEGYEFSPQWPADQNVLDAFHYIRCYTECVACGHQVSYGPYWYWNPESGTYDLPRPLYRHEAEREQVEADRLAQEAAGQLRLL